METELISADEAAKYLGVSAGTLAVWRSTKRYFLPFVKVGHLVRYRPNDLSEFVLRSVKNMPPKNETTESRGRFDRQRKSA
jgi:excisionase family DNA binding protein